ncbi:MAG: hypothetical protein M3N08_09585 [Pseudomonadota bacterium]|nr:hypothetical protein [Pseudomonadota bacterium]
MASHRHHTQKSTTSIRAGFKAAKDEVVNRATVVALAAPGAVAVTGWIVQLAGLLMMQEPGMFNVGSDLSTAGHYIATGGVVGATYVGGDSLKRFYNTFTKKSKVPAPHKARQATKTKTVITPAAQTRAEIIELEAPSTPVNENRGRARQMHRKTLG